MLVPDDQITTWVDVSGAPLEAKWEAIHEHVTQISDESPFLLMGFDGWRDGWANEAYILRESRVDDAAPRDGPVRRDRLGASGPRRTPARPRTYQGKQPLRGREDLAHHDPAGTGRVEEVGLGLVQDDVRLDVDLDELCHGTSARG